MDDPFDDPLNDKNILYIKMCITDIKDLLYDDPDGTALKWIENVSAFVNHYEVLKNEGELREADIEYYNTIVVTLADYKEILLNGLEDVYSGVTFYIDDNIEVVHPISEKDFNIMWGNDSSS